MSVRREAEETLVIAYCDGVEYSFKRSNTHRPSAFGGPCENPVSGLAHGHKPLHHIASLSSADIQAIGAIGRLSSLPLLYGLSYEGNVVTYQIASSEVKVLELRPDRPTNDWPYKDYPALLPYVPLRLTRTKRRSYDAFAQPHSNMPFEQPSELVDAVPPPASIGVSMWGRMGDAEGVTIVFECSLKTRTIKAYNVCG